MVDALHLGVTGERHLVKAHGTELLKGRLEAAEAFERCVGLDKFVAAQNHIAHGVVHRHDRSVKVALGLRMGGAALGLQGVGVHIVAAEAVECCDQVGANALGHKRGLHIGLGVLCPGAPVGAYGHAAHAFHATGHHQVFPAGAYFLRRHVHGFQAGGAKAVDLHARALEIPAGFERGHLG